MNLVLDEYVPTVVCAQIDMYDSLPFPFWIKKNRDYGYEEWK